MLSRRYLVTRDQVVMRKLIRAALTNYQVLENQSKALTLKVLVTKSLASQKLKKSNHLHPAK